MAPDSQWLVLLYALTLSDLRATFFSACPQRCCDWRRFSPPTTIVVRGLDDPPAIIESLACLLPACPDTPAAGPAQTVNLQRKQRAIMSSSSPSDSTSPVQRPSSSKGSSNNRDSDANIRNFAPVARIMKSALPENAKIAKEAKECMQECVSEFISFITSEGEFVCGCGCVCLRDMCVRGCNESCL